MNELCINNIHTYLRAHLTPDELFFVSTPSKSVSVNKVTTRSQHTRQSRFQAPPLTEDVPIDATLTPKLPVRCKACATYGHDEDHCPFVGKLIHCSQFISQLDTSRKRDFLKAYKINREETHKRYIKSLNIKSLKSR